MSAIAQPDTPEGAANLALANLRQPPIATFTDENNRARAVAATFYAARRAMLRMRWWNFATTWSTLAAKAGVVHPSSLKIVYPLPGDCVLVRFVEDADDQEWRVESYKADPAGSDAEVAALITNKAAPLICYTRDVETVKLWDPEFLVAFGWQLAAFAGPQCGASATRVQECQAQANTWREDAAQSDAREKAPTQVTRTTSWITSRRRGGSVSRP